MKRRGAVWILLVLLAFASGCTTAAERSAGTGPVLRGGLGQSRVRSVRMQLSYAQNRIRELETELAEISSTGGAGSEDARVDGTSARERQLTEELAQAKQEAASLRADLDEARAVAAAATAAAERPGASPQIASMQVELDTERSRRQEAEQELNKLREETSAGPYESSGQALQEARAEIDRLNEELARERRQRTDIEQRFAELQVVVDQQEAQPQAADNPEITELEQDQRRLMAAIQQDLEASQRREEELRSTIATLQEGGAPQLTEEVRDLQAENTALQASLDAEHERNVELAAKLEVATRVADLIFKMRREGRLPEALDEAVVE